MKRFDADSFFWVALYVVAMVDGWVLGHMARATLLFGNVAAGNLLRRRLEDRA